MILCSLQNDVGRDWIPHSTFLELRIPGSQTQDSGSHKQKFSPFRIVQAKISSITDCTSKNFLNSGLYKQKFSSIPDHYKQKFSRLRIVQAKISSIPDCTSKNFPRFRIITSKNFPDSGLYKQKFPGLRNPNSLSWGK